MSNTMMSNGFLPPEGIAAGSNSLALTKEQADFLLSQMMLMWMQGEGSLSKKVSKERAPKFAAGLTSDGVYLEIGMTWKNTEEYTLTRGKGGGS